MDRYESGTERYDEAMEHVGNPGHLREQLHDLEFPINKADLLDQLNLKGIPEVMIEKLRGSDTQIFQSADHVLANTQDAF